MIFHVALLYSPESFSGSGSVVQVEADSFYTDEGMVLFTNTIPDDNVRVASFPLRMVRWIAEERSVRRVDNFPRADMAQFPIQTDDQRIRDREILNSGAAVIISPAARIGLGDSTSSPRRNGEVAPVTYPESQRAYPAPPPQQAYNAAQEEQAVQDNMNDVFETADRIVSRAIDNSILARIPPAPDLPPPGMVRFRETVPVTRDTWTY